MKADHKAIHSRWARLLSFNRDTSDPNYEDVWYEQQCGGCCFWFPLSGPLGFDWGVCACEDSEFDGMLRFEHDGCSSFLEGGAWGNPSSEQ
jgi:hypothetical protein